MNAKQILSEVGNAYQKKDLPKFRPGDTVKVYVKVVEGESERIQAFEGVVISKKNSGISENFVVRKISFGIGIERTFPMHSPKITKIELIKQGSVRRAKLYYLRNLSGKAARLDEKKVTVSVASETLQNSPAAETVPA